MSPKRLWIILAAVVLAACGQPAATLTPMPTAVLTDTFELGGHVLNFTAPDKMHDAKMTWAKFQVVYSRGSSPDIVKPLMDEAKAQNFKVLLSIKGAASDVTAANYNTDFATFLGGVAGTYKPDAIEVWNEENLDREWPSGHINGAAYTDLLKLAYPAIKNANAATLVISGAPAPTGFFQGQCMDAGCDDNVFIQQMATAGAAAYMDCVGIHYNEGVLPPSATSGDPRDNSSFYSRYYPAMVNLYTSVFPSKPLCFTEIGYLSPEGYGAPPSGFEWAANVTVQNQADWLGQAVTLSRQQKRVRLFIVWNVDSTEYDADPQAGYAIVRKDGSCSSCATLAAAMQ